MRPKRGTVYKRAGSPYWWISFVTNGRRHSRSTKIPKTKPKQDARDVLDHLRGEAKKGIRPDSDKISLADLERLVLANLEMNGRRSASEDVNGKHVAGRAELAYAHLEEHLAATPALEIPPILDEYIAARLKKAEPATVRQELRWLGRGYRLASEKGLLPYRPALPSIEVDNARQGFVTEEQLEKLVAALAPHMQGPARFAFLTAWRKSEILTLKWSSIDLENGIARVEAAHSKNRRSREFPYGAMPDLKALIDEQRAATTAWERAHAAVCPWVFHRNGKPIRSFYTAWKNACERAGIDVLFHDLRRSAIRQMELAGVPRSTAMKLSGHRTESTYTRYAISSQSDLEAGVAKVVAFRTSRAAKQR